MKTVNFLSILVITIICYSCNNNGNNNKSDKDSTAVIKEAESENSLPDFSGHYKLPIESGDLDLTITKETNVFKYNLKGDGGKLDVYGTLSIDKESDDIYLTFDGAIENNQPKSIRALFNDSVITIQNSGNAQQGSWVLFPYCNAKYLEFNKN